ncbi:hypothetical protein Tcan_08799 [Toxocara canis]|uniref:Uncharacterized protein n=1 Tax=Toxocara canis TaxID=6265 RepID=A0A0B2UMS1_TOXCA|nr:hypothetical protein Tcan_08799 [Toxocara canis]
MQFILSESLSCFDGADCIATASCGECSGVACMRFRSFNIEHNHEIALTCLPYATRSFQLEPAGCHISGTGDGEVCICYDKDYCNRAISSFIVHTVYVFLIAIFMIF